MKPIQTIVETVLYVDDLDATVAFYRDLLGFPLHQLEPERHVFFRVGDTMLLAFLPDATEQGGALPPHGARGEGHVAFGIADEEREPWREKLIAAGIGIELDYTWPRGGKSLYFRDPSGNLVELVTPGVWGLPSGW
ncbi:MAG: VOC family protein [Planctomycetaceae bacterium]